MRRMQGLAAAVVVALLVGGAAYADRELGPRDLSEGATPTARSGEWFCPHGGGEAGWEVFLQVANPGERPATIRVRTLGAKRPTEPQVLTVDAGSFVRVPVSADGRERASMIEWFDQWVAVGWLAHAGGEEGGIAAEPCAPVAGERWLLPDGTSETELQDDYVVVMNPFARDAVFSVVLLSERRQPVVFSELTDVVLRPYRSRAIRINDVVEGERTVSALVEASVGRVVAGTLGVSLAGGIRSAIGYLGEPPGQLTFPGSADAGHTDLVVMSTGIERVAIGADLLGEETEQPLAGLADSAPPAQSGRTYTATTAGPTSIVFTAEGPGIAADRRTYGAVSDQGASGGAIPAPVWLILPTVEGSPSHPGLVLANPGAEPVTVTLSYLAPDSAGSVTVTIAARRTAEAPTEFLEAAPEGAVLATTSSGAFVPAAASYARGREGFATYAIALGVPIPDEWVPA